MEIDRFALEQRLGRLLSDVEYNRFVVCANAMDGIDDPIAFMEYHKDLLEKALATQAHLTELANKIVFYNNK